MTKFKEKDLNANENLPAFACASANGHQEGLTKLEHFAGLAMQGVLSGIYVNLEENNWDVNDCARDTASLAHALLQALEE